MAINLMAPKGNDKNAKLTMEIWKKINESKKKAKTERKK